MVRINRETGLFFAAGEGDQAMLQSVRDRLMVPIGDRLGRPNYGSLLPGGSPRSNAVIDSVRNALASDTQIENVEFSLSGDTLLIDVNHRLRIMA